MKKIVLIVWCCLAGCLAVTTVRSSNIQYVDVMIGTGADGHTYPGATLLSEWCS